MSNPVPRDTFARLYADADADRRLPLLAALFAARGWETTVADGAVRARRGEATRRFVPAPDADDEDATAADAGDADDATVVDADAAREALLYALDPDAADDVLDRHFGRPARSPDYDLTTAGPSDRSATTGVQTDATSSPPDTAPSTSAVDAPSPPESAADGSAATSASEARDAAEPGVGPPHDGGDETDGGPGDGDASAAPGRGSGAERPRSVALVRVALVVAAVALIATAALGTGVGPFALGGSSGAAAPANATETASPAGTKTATPTPSSTPEPTTPSPWTATPSGSSGERYFSMRPTCERPPDDVVHLQVRALGYNRAEGTRVAYRFASPANKRFMGPFSAFRGIFRTDTYRPMLGYETATFGRPSVDGDVARQNVTLRAGDATATYEFTLSKQEDGQYHGCWMTDTVERLDEP